MKIHLSIFENIEDGSNIFQKAWNGFWVIWDHWISQALKLWDQESLELRNQDTKKLWNQATKKHWNQETKKLWNQETKNLWNQETKKQETKKPTAKKPRNNTPRNQETKKPINFSSKGIPSTPQHTDSHPCTRPGSPSLFVHPTVLQLSVLPGKCRAVKRIS